MLTMDISRLHQRISEESAPPKLIAGRHIIHWMDRLYSMATGHRKGMRGGVWVMSRDAYRLFHAETGLTHHRGCRIVIERNVIGIGLHFPRPWKHADDRKSGKPADG